MENSNDIIGNRTRACHWPDIRNNNESTMHKSTNQLKVNEITSVKVNAGRKSKPVPPAMRLQFLLTALTSSQTEAVSCRFLIITQKIK
jgi:hypothetical protein